MKNCYLHLMKWTEEICDRFILCVCTRALLVLTTCEQTDVELCAYRFSSDFYRFTCCSDVQV